MRLRTLGAVLMFGAVPLVACQDEGPFAPRDAQFVKLNGSTHRPVQGWSKGTQTFGVPCAPTAVALTVSGDGELSHMGAIHVDISGCFDFLTFATVGTASGVLTAANGDQVFMNMTSFVVDPVTMATTGQYQITGGTGRFAGATGSFTSSGTPSTEPGIMWQNTLHGWIAY